ncbi:MAG: undecaprenyl-diphosphate phosphatase [Betaproteobacteria bacterium]|nr:undecaprenyl-diphosphate phosphatase [Betaproteobacteria bacterium]
MDITLLIKAAILGIIEGLTEFLPVSSTGHLILAGSLLDFNDAKAQVFDIFIQTGAILAVCWEYRARLISTFSGITHDPRAQRFVKNLAIAFMPLAVLGLLFNKPIKAVLFHPVPVAIAFIVGGIIIMFAERWYQRRLKSQMIDLRDQPPGVVAPALISSVDDMTWKDALKLGFAQCAALIPGTSRSGATIIGGLFFGLSRKCATEFSFFLAIPTLLAATVYSVWKDRALLSSADVPMFSVGFITAFISAFLCVRWLLRYVSSHDFTPFAWYRIVFGVIVLLTAYTGTVNWHLH